MDSKSNPADDVSRSLTAECLIESKRRLNGPDFLWKKEECWPKRIVVADLSIEHPDVKLEGRVLMASHQNALHPFIDHYSSWDRLKRGVAWLLRFKGYLSSKLHGKQGVNQRIIKAELSVEILAAERAVLTAVQQESFKDYFTRSSSTRSPLHSLLILCRVSLSVVIAPRRCSIQASCLCRLSFSTKSVKICTS